MPGRAATLLALSVALMPASALAQQAPVDQGAPNVPEFSPAFPNQTRAPAERSGIEVEAVRFAGPLVHPWGIDALPDGGYVVTERPGRMRTISADGTISEPIEGVPEVFARRQGGLLDVAVGPDFATDRLIYWTYSKPMDGGTSATAAARGRLSDDLSSLTDVEDIFVQTPPSPTAAHYGSRLAFDGEGHLFVTTGEHFTESERQNAQKLDATYGKVVRIDPDGGIPADNPFAGRDGALPEIWTLGHRNVQGAAIEPGSGRLWTVEHGPQGGDELNIAAAGSNFGWPIVSYGENYNGSPVGSGEARHSGDFVEPRYYWDPVIAPSGMLFYEGSLFGAWRGDLLIGSLSPGGLVRLSVEGDSVVGEERFLGDRGRFRDLAVAPDGSILVLVDADEGSVLRLTPADADG